MTITAPLPPAPAHGPQPAPPALRATPEPVPQASPGRARPPARGAIAGRSRLEMAGLAALLVLTALAYLWDLSASGYANSFYAAAVEAGTKSWKALFFGSLDSSNFITVDKPPASLWVMALSGRLFGFSSWSMLAPEALMGVGTVALVYGTVRRWSGAVAGLIAGTVMAITPVAALMFRFNNPDALLTLLMAAGAYCVTRAIERAGTWWLVACGATVGLGFLDKMGEALLVVPAFGLAYLVAAPARLGRRLLQLMAAGSAAIVSAGWWVLIVTLWPTSSRPMIDGSPTNSIWNLIVGYNGLGRLEGSSGGGGGGANFSGSTGVFRLFNSLMGGQASWLLPAALVSLATGLVICGRSGRTDRRRAALVIWGGWLLVTAAVFSLGQGTIHTYYTVALAPPIAALVGIGAARLWESRRAVWARLVAAVTVAGTAAWAVDLLGRTPTWYGWLRPTIAIAAAMAVVGIVVIGHLARHTVSPWAKRAGVLALAAVATACLLGPLAFTLQTTTTAHTGSIPTAGPATDASAFGGGAGRSSGGLRSPGRAGNGTVGRGATGPGQGSPPGGASTGTFGPTSRSSAPAGAGAGTQGQVSSALVKALKDHTSDYRWVAATDGSQNAATLELATGGSPVMAIGGFNNNGGNISLATFEHYVKEGAVHYYIAGSVAGGPGGGSSSSSEITAWVEAHFTAKTIGGETIYDLTSPLAN